MKTKHYNIITAGLIGVTACAGSALNAVGSYADDTHTDTTNITVPESCSMTGTVNTAHTATLNPGTWSGASGTQFENGIGKTTLTTFCNDNDGFSIYAVGSTGDTEGTNTLVGANTNLAIDTGVYSSGDTTSSWAMKVQKVENPQQGDPITWNPQYMTIQEDTEGYFNTWHTVPDDYTKVAEYKATTTGTSSTTDTALGAKLETTYAAYIASNQPADTYSGKVKYVMVHPYSEPAPEPCPDEEPCIRVTALPTRTSYEDGDAIDTTGMVAKAYYGDGRLMQVIPNNEIQLVTSSASIADSKWESDQTEAITSGSYTITKLASPRDMFNLAVSQDPFGYTFSSNAQQQIDEWLNANANKAVFAKIETYRYGSGIAGLKMQAFDLNIGDPVPFGYKTTSSHFNAWDENSSGIHNISRIYVGSGTNEQVFIGEYVPPNDASRTIYSPINATVSAVQKVTINWTPTGATTPLETFFTITVD